jgi:hypothetical protein
MWGRSGRRAAEEGAAAASATRERETTAAFGGYNSFFLQPRGRRFLDVRYDDD